jgi:hypothetical protein
MDVRALSVYLSVKFIVVLSLVLISTWLRMLEALKRIELACSLALSLISAAVMVRSLLLLMFPRISISSSAVMLSVWLRLWRSKMSFSCPSPPSNLRALTVSLVAPARAWLKYFEWESLENRIPSRLSS